MTWKERFYAAGHHDNCNQTSKYKGVHHGPVGRVKWKVEVYFDLSLPSITPMAHIQIKFNPKRSSKILRPITLYEARRIALDRAAAMIEAIEDGAFEIEVPAKFADE